VESVLHRYAPTDMPIHAVFPAGRLVAPRTRAFVDFIAASFRGDPSTAASEAP